MKQHGMFKSNCAVKMKTARDVSEILPRLEKEAGMGCVRETPHRQIKPSLDV